MDSPHMDPAVIAVQQSPRLVVPQPGSQAHAALRNQVQQATEPVQTAPGNSDGAAIVQGPNSIENS